MPEQSNAPPDLLHDLLIEVRRYIFQQEHRTDRNQSRAQKLSDRLTAHIIVLQGNEEEPANSITAEDVLGEIILHAHHPEEPRAKVLVQTPEQRALARRMGQKAVASFRLEEIEARRIREAVKGKVQLPPEVDR